MHTLARQVRFSIDPFAQGDTPGRNSFASNPPGEGLAIFFSLWVELAGTIDPQTGFIINIVEIDKAVRTHAVPIFGDCIRKKFAAGQSVSFNDLAQLLAKTWSALEPGLANGSLASLKLELNPFRSIAIDTEHAKMMYINEKFEFAATHTLWNDQFSPQKNFEVFGKCANPTGHGHNYVIEVSLKVPADRQWMGIGQMEQIVDEHLISVVDHKNINVDVPAFSRMIPTVENIAVFAWNTLTDKFEPGILNCINVWETDKTYCSYCGK